MGKDLTYIYFKMALDNWLASDENTQKVLAVESGYTKGYISQLLDEDRKKPIGFEPQIRLAMACGYDYLSFLQRGKYLLEGEASKVYSLGSAQKQHHEIIEKFEDPEMAKQFNENLVIIEKHAKKSYNRLFKESENLAEALKEAVGPEQNQEPTHHSPKKTGTDQN